MNIKRGIILSFLFCFFLSFAFSQSLVEVAKKEKKRRAAFKGKMGIVVTNADLKKNRRHSSIMVPQSSPKEKTSLPSRSPAPHRRGKRTQPYRVKKGIESSVDQKRGVTLDSNPQETVELLTGKMNFLQQQFYSFRDWTLRDDIQRELVKTYEKLKRAQKAAEKEQKKPKKR